MKKPHPPTCIKSWKPAWKKCEWKEKNLFRERQESVNSGGIIKPCYGQELTQLFNDFQEVRDSERRQSKGKYFLEWVSSLEDSRKTDTEKMQSRARYSWECSYLVQGLEERIEGGFTAPYHSISLPGGFNSTYRQPLLPPSAWADKIKGPIPSAQRHCTSCPSS